MPQKKFSIYNLDLFVPDLKLNLEGQSGVGTKVGLGLSVAFLGVFASLAYLIISDFFDTRKPRVTQTINSTELPPFISFTEDKLFPILVFRYGGTAPLDKIQLARFVTIDFTKVELNYDASGGVVTSVTSMKVARCSELVAQGRLGSFQVESKAEREVLLNEGICVDPGDGDVSLGRRTQKDAFYQQYLWRIFPCSLPAGCATRQELGVLTFTSIIPKPNLDLSNKKEPVRYDTLVDEPVYLSTSISGRMTLSLIKTDIIDEAGFLQGDSTAKSFTAIQSSTYSASDRDQSQLSCSPAQFATELGCNPYWAQTILTNPRKMIIKRQYKGMVETFSELGGMLDILFMIFVFPYTIYNRKILNHKLVEIIHGVRKPTKPSKNATSANDTSYKQQTEAYNRLIEDIDTCLDLVHLSKEVKSLWKVIRSHGLEQSESPEARGSEKAFSDSGAIIPRDSPIELKLQSREKNFKSTYHASNQQPANSINSVFSKKRLSSHATEKGSSNFSEPNSIRLLLNNKLSNQIEYLSDGKEQNKNASERDNTFNMQFGIVHKEGGIGGVQEIKVDPNAPKQKPHTSKTGW